MKKPTLKDIARKARTAISTVSLVVNNQKRVDPKTRARIKKIIEELNYYPDENAKMLVKGRSNEIAFISTAHASPFVAKILDSFEQRARTLGKYPFGIRTFSTFSRADYTRDLLRMLLYGKNIDGVLLLTQPVPRDIELEYQRRGVPLLLVENDSRGALSLKVDNWAGVELAVQRFKATRKKRIGLIIGWVKPLEGELQSPTVVERYQAFKASMKTHGLPFDEDYVFHVRFHDQKEGHDAFDYFNGMKVKPDAVFCAAGDITAMGFLEAAAMAHVRIPEDIAIIGYDDIPTAALLAIPLTTIRQPVDRLGEMAFDTLLAAIEGRVEKNKKILLKPDISIRKSG
jgi:LacI family transcriptional regulator